MSTRKNIAIIPFLKSHKDIGEKEIIETQLFYSKK